MRTNPRSEREIKSDMVLPPGEYDFEVASAAEKTSKNGNEMIELSLRVFPRDGSGARLVRDWLVSGTPMGDLKINRFCHCTGLQDAYFADELSAMLCEGQAGTLKLTITGSEQYGDQNQVKDYIVVVPEQLNQDDPGPPLPKGVPTAQTQRANSVASNDDIPF